MQAQALHGREITGSVTQLVSTGGGNTVFLFFKYGETGTGIKSSGSVSPICMVRG
jgi:hypothetical protein